MLRSKALAVICLALGLSTLTPRALAQDNPETAGAARIFTDSRIVKTDHFSVEVTGQGPDVILVPGLAASRETWRATAERLRGAYRLHLVQVAGFAGEPAGANASGEVLVPTAEALDAYIVDQHLAPVVFVGHSMGGAMGLYLAENHPDHVKKLAIVDSPPFAPVMLGMGPSATADSVRPLAEEMKGASIAAGDLAYAQMLEPQLARMTASAERRKQLLQWSLDSLRDAVAQGFYDTMMLDQRPGLGRITAPVTVIFPDNVTGGMAAGMAEAIYADQYAPVADLTLTPIANAQHFVMWDQPAAFAAALDAFLAPTPTPTPTATTPAEPAPAP